MRQYNWSKIITMSCVLVANLAAALFAVFFTMAFSLGLNIDLLESGDWAPTAGDKLNALFKVSMVSIVFLLFFGGIVTACNWKVCRIFASDEVVARKWTFFLGFLPVGGVLLGAAYCAMQILRRPKSVNSGLTRRCTRPPTACALVAISRRFGFRRRVSLVVLSPRTFYL